MSKLELIENDESSNSVAEDYLKRVDSIFPSIEEDNFFNDDFQESTVIEFLQNGSYVLRMGVKSFFNKKGQPILDNEYDKNVKLSSEIQPFNDEAEKIPNYHNFTKKELLKEILSFKSLNNNWDGHGAIPLEIESATNVLMLIEIIGEDLFCRIDDIFPNPNGTISLKWINDLKEKISLEVGNATMSYYVSLTFSKPLFFNDIKINSNETKEISKYINQLYKS
ncbi:hypothetical protein BH23BAC1_BH23BAC1_40810 [soil metagenome]